MMISTLASHLKDWPDLLEKNVLSLPISGTGAGHKDFIILLTFYKELNLSRNLYLADPGEARGCSTNTFVSN